MKLENSKQDWIFRSVLLPGTAIYVCLLLFKFPFTPFFSETDQLIFIHEGSRLLNGDVMYRGFFEFTFPGAQTIYYLLLALFGETYRVLPLTTVFLGVASTWLCFEISKEILRGPMRYLPPVIYVLFGLRWFGLDGSHRLFSPIFVSLAILVLIKGRGLYHVAAAGAFCAAASFFTQQRGVAMLASITCFLVVQKIMSGDRWKPTWQAASVLYLTFGLVMATMLGYFVYSAGVADFVYATLVYPVKYYSYAPSNSYGVYLTDLAKAAESVGPSGMLFLASSIFYACILPASLLLTLVLFAVQRRTLAWEEWKDPIFLAIVGTLLILTTAGPNSTRLYQVCVPSLIVFCWLFSKADLFRRLERPLVIAVTSILVAIGVSQVIRMQTHWNYFTLNTPSGELIFTAADQARFYDAIAAKTKPGDLIYEPIQPYVYFPLQLKNPTRYGQIWPTDYTRPEQVAEVVLDLEHKTPKYILWDNGYLISDIERPTSDHTGPLAELVQRDYSPVGDIYQMDGHPIQIWERKAQ